MLFSIQSKNRFKEILFSIGLAFYAWSVWCHWLYVWSLVLVCMESLCIGNMYMRLLCIGLLYVLWVIVYTCRACSVCVYVYEVIVAMYWVSLCVRALGHVFCVYCVWNAFRLRYNLSLTFFDLRLCIHCSVYVKKSFLKW